MPCTSTGTLNIIPFENNLVGRDMDESMEEDSFPEQEGASVEGRSQDDENGAVLEDNIGDVDTEEEEEGAVTVLFSTEN
jgi:hypothetical protein